MADTAEGDGKGARLVLVGREGCGAGDRMTGQQGAQLASTDSAVSAPAPPLAQTLPHTLANSSACSKKMGQEEPAGTPVNTPEENVLQLDRESESEAMEHEGRGSKSA